MLVSMGGAKEAHGLCKKEATPKSHDSISLAHTQWKREGFPSLLLVIAVLEEEYGMLFLASW